MAGSTSPERRALQKKANTFCALGLVLQFAVRLLIFTVNRSGGSLVLAFALLIVSMAGILCWVIGLAAYAESKGYSGWYGLFGLLSCCGLIILALLPDGWVDESSAGYRSGDYPRPND